MILLRSVQKKLIPMENIHIKPGIIFRLFFWLFLMDLRCIPLILGEKNPLTIYLDQPNLTWNM